MFKILQTVPTPVALNAVHQAVRLLQHRVKPTVPRSKVVVKGTSGSPTALEFSIAQKIVKEIQAVEGRSILSIEPKKVQKYVTRLADLILKRVTGEIKSEPAEAQSLLENLKKYDPTRGSRYLNRGTKSRKRSGAVMV
jgi:hypothetical protein